MKEFFFFLFFFIYLLPRSLIVVTTYNNFGTKGMCVMREYYIYDIPVERWIHAPYAIAYGIVVFFIV